MKSYLLTLFGVCLVSVIVRIISPEGATKKYIEMICSVCVIAAVAMPVVKAITGFDGDNIDIGLGGEYEEQDYGEIYNSNLLNENRLAAEELLKNELTGLLSVSSDSLRVSLRVSQSADGAVIDSATVYIGGGAVASDPQRIKDYIGERLSVECQIIYEIFDEK